MYNMLADCMEEGCKVRAVNRHRSKYRTYIRYEVNNLHPSMQMHDGHRRLEQLSVLQADTSRDHMAWQSLVMQAVVLQKL